MSSRTLYPPIVDSYMPAFVIGETGSSCTVYFSLSKFNGSGDFKTVHVAITDQATGRNVLKTIRGETDTRYYATGIMLNVFPQKVEGQDNLYTIEIDNSDLIQGWTQDRIYKIQLRLANAIYDGNSDTSEAVWLKGNADLFSEWSTVCIIKAIGKINYALPILDIDTSNETETTAIEDIHTLYASTLNLVGSFSRPDNSTELINTYRFILYDKDNNILEDSGDIYTNKYSNTDSFNYLFKTELQNSVEYSLAFKFVTVNKYEGGFYYFDDSIDDRYHFICSISALKVPPCSLLTVENDIKLLDIPDIDDSKKHVHHNRMDKDIDIVSLESPIEKWEMADIIGTSIYTEEEEGRVAIKFYDSEEEVYSGNLCIRRADSKDNFQTWTDIYVYVCKQENINGIPIFYDYTIESGVWYKYGVQTIESNGDRGQLDIIKNPVMRNFNYTFLLGKDNQQLKLEFDNIMGSFKYQIYDSKADPIGSKYTHIARNANTYYRTFPLNGLITFNMDESELFCNKRVIYGYESIVELYQDYNEENGITQYDYIYEKDFREKVLEFLQDGEVKLFKSPTEGNIIIRLTEVNCTPNQSLDRLIYSFSAIASEMDAPTMENYLSYGFYKVAPYESSFAVYETKLGQIDGEITIGEKNNVFDMILAKYGDGKQNLAGYTKMVANVHHIKITFNNKPLRLKNNAGELIVGYNFVLDGNTFTVFNPSNIYEFDNRLVYDPTMSSLYFLGDDEGKITKVNVTIDFLYDLKTDEYVEKEITSRTTKQGLGQLYSHCYPNEDLFTEIYLKYNIKWTDQFLELARLSSIWIEANPGACFLIKDLKDAEPERHIVGATGLLEFFEIENIVGIKYEGMYNPVTEQIESKSTDVLLNYIYITTKGTYKQT